MRTKDQFTILSLLLILLGSGALIHQYFFTSSHSLFQVSDILHHEVIAVSLWCLAFGILIGTHTGKEASDTRKQ